METCKTCRHWRRPDDERSELDRQIQSHHAEEMCSPSDQDAYVKMDRGFEVRICCQPTQTRFEAPVEKNGFGLTDASMYFAVLATAEEFGCNRHETV